MQKEKTNVMRLLDSKKVCYDELYFTPDPTRSGKDATIELGIPCESTFKTLVTVGKSGKYYVFDIPVEKELDLRKGANAVNEKNIAMIKSKDLLALTGYVHGGCSPIGMKKFFTTTFDCSVENYQKIVFSGGRVGCFVRINYGDLGKMIKFSVADLCL